MQDQQPIRVTFENNEVTKPELDETEEPSRPILSKSHQKIINELKRLNKQSAKVAHEILSMDEFYEMIKIEKAFGPIPLGFNSSSSNLDDGVDKLSSVSNETNYWRFLQKKMMSTPSKFKKLIQIIDQASAMNCSTMMEKQKKDLQEFIQKQVSQRSKQQHQELVERALKDNVVTKTQITEMMLQKGKNQEERFIQDLKNNMVTINKNFNQFQERIILVNNLLKKTYKETICVDDQDSRIDSRWSKKRWDTFYGPDSKKKYLADRDGQRDEQQSSRLQTKTVSNKSKLDSDSVVAERQRINRNLDRRVREVSLNLSRDVQAAEELTIYEPKLRSSYSKPNVFSDSMLGSSQKIQFQTSTQESQQSLSTELINCPSLQKSVKNFDEVHKLRQKILEILQNLLESIDNQIKQVDNRKALKQMIVSPSKWTESSEIESILKKRAILQSILNFARNGQWRLINCEFLDLVESEFCNKISISNLVQVMHEVQQCPSQAERLKIIAESISAKPKSTAHYQIEQVSEIKQRMSLGQKAYQKREIKIRKDYSTEMKLKFQNQT